NNISKIKKKLKSLKIHSPKPSSGLSRHNSFSTPKSTNNKPTTPSPTVKKKIKYRVTFPPGAMGLELEPIIRSKDVELGCRVKNFYFRYFKLYKFIYFKF